MSLADVIAQKQILVVCGAGGVGKTSVSAALALAASRDRKTIVLTIDPAKRLASALGLRGGLGHAEARVDTGDDRRELFAAMLDMKSAWDELVERFAPSPDVSQSIRSNRLYQGLSEHFVGSQGYMAMERLADLYERSDYDLIVIDTPPTRHALDFLEAPKRMTDFVGGSLLRWFAKPYSAAGRLGARAFNVTASPLLKIADRILGSLVLEDLSSFVLDFQKLYDGFKERAAEVLQLLHRPHTGFVVVTTLENGPLEEAGFFLDRLSDERLPIAGTVANRVIPQRYSSPRARDALAALVPDRGPAVAGAAGIADDAAVHALETMRHELSVLCDLAQRDAQCIYDLERRARVPVMAVPLMSHDVHDLESLGELARYLVGS